MPIFRKKNQDRSIRSGRANTTNEVVSNYALRPVVPTSVACENIRNAIEAVFAFETLGFRLMRVAPPLDSDGPGVRIFHQTGQPLTVSYLENFPAWPSWMALYRNSDPRLGQVAEERASEAQDMFNLLRLLITYRVSPDNPELERVQIASEFTCGTSINCFDDEDAGLMFYLAGDNRKFRAAADRLREQKSNSEWAKSQLRDALSDLKRSRPDQFALLAINSADYISIGGIEFWQEIMEPTTCPSCSNSVDDPSDRFCAICGHSLAR
jgi:hypothetical protein